MTDKNIGSMYIVIGAKTAELTAALQATQKDLKDFAKQYSAGLKDVGAALAGMGGAIVAAGITSAKAYAEMGDAVLTMSKKTGMSTQAISELSYAAEIAPLLDKGETVGAEVIAKDRFAGTDGKMKWGCQIQVTKPEYRKAKQRGCAIGCLVTVILFVLIVVAIVRCGK